MLKIPTEVSKEHKIFHDTEENLVILQILK